MANSRAIAAVAMAIRRVLEPAVDAGVEVKLYQASDFQRAETANVLSLYLYRVAANGNQRTVPARPEADGRRFRPALLVDLYYLISAWSSSVEAQHRLLGQVMRALEDTPTLPAALLNDGDRGAYAGTFRSSEAVELVYDPLPLADMIALWDLLKPGILPSSTYVARAVAIESEVEILVGEPVVERQFDYVKPVDALVGRAS
jgi:Pvc16 N-terminal domain